MKRFTVKGYEIEEQIGKGAGSWIFRVRSLEDHTVKAVKIVLRRSRREDPFVWQIRNEYQVASSFDHPHLVKILGFEEIRKLLHPSQYNLLMEYVDGPTLADYRHKDLRVVLRLFIQVADALSYIHEKGFIHSDVKPSNILVKPGMVAKLLDFGLICRKGTYKPRVQGTIDFIAPEQISKGMIDERTDVYNLAATMYRVLTGRNIPSFLGHGREIFVSHKLKIPPVREFNRQVPFVLEELIMRSLSPAKSLRPSSMTEVSELLVKVAEKLDPPG